MLKLSLKLFYVFCTLFLLVEHVLSIQGKITLKVCSESGYLPFEAKNQQGEWYGFDIKMMNEFAKTNNYKIEFIDTSFESLIPSLVTKKCDIIASGMSITNDRKKVVFFSEPVYVTSEAIAISNSHKNLTNIRGINDLDKEGINISIKTGLTSDLYLSQKGVLKHAKLLKFNSDSEAISAVLEGRADAIVNDKPILLVAAKIHKNKLTILPYIIKKESVMPVGVAFRKQDKKLRETFNIFLNQWKKEGSYQNTVSYYFDEMSWL